MRSQNSLLLFNSARSGDHQLPDDLEKIRLQMESRRSSQIGSPRLRPESKQSMYDTAIRKKRIYQDGIKQIILDAFREFRGHQLNELQLNEFESRVCQNNYMLSQDDAGRRILELLETVTQEELD